MTLFSLCCFFLFDVVVYFDGVFVLRLLQEFAEKYGDGLVVIYSLSGWLKNNATYHIRLVPKHMLSGDSTIQAFYKSARLTKLKLINDTICYALWL